MTKAFGTFYRMDWKHWGDTVYRLQCATAKAWQTKDLQRVRQARDILQRRSSQGRLEESWHRRRGIVLGGGCLPSGCFQVGLWEPYEPKGSRTDLLGGKPAKAYLSIPHRPSRAESRPSWTRAHRPPTRPGRDPRPPFGGPGAAAPSRCRDPGYPWARVPKALAGGSGTAGEKASPKCG